MAGPPFSTPDLPPPSLPPAPIRPGGGAVWARLHLWQIQWVRDLLVIAAIVGVVYLGYVIRIVTVPMLLALLLAYLFEPLVRWLLARKLATRRSAVLATITAVVLLIIVPLTVGAGFGAVQGARAVGNLAANVSRVQKSLKAPGDEQLREAIPPGGWRRIREFLAENGEPAPPGVVAPTEPAATTPGAEGETPQHPGVLERLSGREEMRDLGRMILAWLEEHAADLSAVVGARVASGSAEAARAAITTVAAAFRLLLTFLLTILFFYFFSTGWGRLLEFWESFIPESRRGRVVGIVQKMDRAIAGFVRGRITIGAIEGCYFTLMYWLAGVPMPLLLGPIVGVLFIVPFLQVLGVPVAMLLMWFNNVEGPIFAPHMAAGSGGLWYILIVPFCIHLAANWLDDYFLTPTIQGKHTDLAMPTIIFASIAGGALAGIYGLLLAIPVAACVRILIKEVFWPRIQAWVRGEVQDVLPIGRE